MSLVLSIIESDPWALVKMAAILCIPFVVVGAVLLLGAVAAWFMSR